MESVSINYVSCENGEWEWIYADNKLYAEGHSLSVDNFLELIGDYKNFGTISKLTLSEEQMEEVGPNLPYEYEKVIGVVKR